MSPFATELHLEEALRHIEDGKQHCRRRREQYHLNIYELVERKIRAAKGCSDAHQLLVEFMVIVGQLRSAQRNASVSPAMGPIADGFADDVDRWIECYNKMKIEA
jgi:hypothetical protein